MLGAGESYKGQGAGAVDLTYSGAVWSGPPAFAMAGVRPADIQYASIYDSFTITVLMQLEDLGFCAKGEGGRFVADGNLISGVGKLPFNTDGGGLCNNHPANRGGITKVIEAVRQLRGEAHPAVQVPGCTLALAHGTGGFLGSRHGSATLILERECMADRVSPAPPASPESAAFYAAAREGRFMIGRCTGTGRCSGIPARCRRSMAGRRRWSRPRARASSTATA